MEGTNLHQTLSTGINQEFSVICLVSDSNPAVGVAGNFAMRRTGRWGGGGRVLKRIDIFDC